MRELVAKWVLLLASAFAAPAVLAQELAPDALLRAVAADVIGKINRDPELQSANSAKLAALVETRILPLFDFGQMTQLAVARNWRLATPEQQKALTEEFKTLLVRTYSSALADYRGEAIDFRQLHAASPDGDVTVRSEVKQTGRERVTLDYRMRKTSAGWKIYNVKVAGVCLVTNYREVFAEKFRDGGVDGLVNYLAAENRGSASRFNTISASFWEQSRVMYAIFQNVLLSGWQ